MRRTSVSSQASQAARPAAGAAARVPRQHGRRESALRVVKAAQASLPRVVSKRRTVPRTFILPTYETFSPGIPSVLQSASTFPAFLADISFAKTGPTRNRRVSATPLSL